MDSSPKPAAGPIADLGRTVLQPGLIWACHSAEGRTKMVEDGEPPADCAFRWLHLNLADQRSLNWIERAIVMPPAILQAAQRTNRNLYFLSILTALLMPATLVTGFFGMNTGGLPFAHGAARHSPHWPLCCRRLAPISRFA